MRFLFIDSKVDDPHLLVLDYCTNCKPPQDFMGGWVYPNAADRRGARCFTCSKPFDGDTSAYEIIIDLDGVNIGKKNEVL